MPHHTVLELKDQFDHDKTSLGIVRPSRVLEVKVEQAGREWKPEWAALYTQMRLFGDPPKPLMKLPFKWNYVFECTDSTTAHNAMIEDWELGALFLNLREKQDEAKAAQIVSEKYFDMCAPDRDTRFFMGTTFPYNTWVVIGVFWPPRAYQGALGL